MEAISYLNRIEKSRQGIEALVTTCYSASLHAGWWNDIQTGKPIQPTLEVRLSKLMLVVTEIAEAVEGERKNLRDDKLTHRAMAEVELADAIIRICDYAGACGYDLPGAIVEKLAFNASRPDHKIENRLKDGGKKL